ncbi:endonuclease/exonuclease/phosphatase family protein [Sphingobacterium chuzhouense]|uniref:Endonuclease/exonuclease/phosphatase family protein n=1 Tax=Sphingobacterium chuzhouense TaxID=1742264 RepID=A0ABR7XVL5_9SPHI|nr:endonuclease/exonuclease/phosphatase family protein [Sphingobacterium chuzhouense]MBD1423078.1 endonuclease/exonuclease/phosphatase family protein [Sphingobacterium chuzhouense]
MQNKLPIVLLTVFFLAFINVPAVVAQQKIKILSYNVLYGLQKDSVENIERYKQLINELQPDIVATQEMNGWTQKTLEELAKSYGHSYALQSKETGFPVALTSNTPLVNFKKITENMWHAYIYAKVKGLHIFVIHFSPFSYQKRLEEVTEIIAQAGELPAGEPILIMGDFNAMAESDREQYGGNLVQTMQKSEEKHAHIRNLNNGQIDYSVLNKLKEAGFRDSYKLLNKEFISSLPTFKDGNGKITRAPSGIPRRIDFLWCNDAAAKRVITSTILKNAQTHYISDHYPVYVEMTVE